MANKSYSYLLFFIAISIALDLFTLRNALALGIVQPADWPIPALNFNQFVNTFFGAWNYQTSAPSGLNLYMVTTGYLSVISSNPAIIQKVFYFLPWAMTPFAMYIFLNGLGIRKYVSIPFSLLYQYGPWITGEFMDGEPVMVMLYLFLPLFLYVYLRFRNNFLLLYVALSLVLIVPVVYTLQSLFTYLFFLLPFFLNDLAHKRYRNAAISILAILLSSITVIAATFYSISAYSSAFSEIRGNPVSYFLSFPPAVSAHFWLILFFSVSLGITLLSWLFRYVEVRTLFLIWTFESLFMILIYPGLGVKSIGYLLLGKVFIFAPFIDYDKFILFFWFQLLVFSAWIISLSVKESKVKKSTTKTHANLHRGITLVVVIFAVTILVSSSATLEIQSFGSHDTGRYLFTDGTHFQESKVSPNYINLVNFLLDNNVSYGLSSHTILFPENPGSVLPFYVSQQIIPGYMWEFDKNIAQAIINGLNNNNSNFLMLLSIYGVKYLAVMDIPSTTWPGSNGTPSLSTWGSNYIFVGNWTFYLHDLETLSGLSLSYDHNGLFIFKNKYYISPIIDSSTSSIQNLTSGNYTHFINTTPTSNNILKNATFYYSGSGYKVDSPLDINITGNETIYAYSFIKLLPDRSYYFSLEYNTTENLTRYYGNGQSGAAVFYNVSPTSWNITGVIVLTMEPAYVANGTYSCIFKTPAFKGRYIDAKVNIQFQPPVDQAYAISKVTHLELYSINGSNEFFSDFKSVKILKTIYTNFKIYPNTGGVVVMDQFYGSGWLFRTSTQSGELTHLSSGLMGFYANSSGVTYIYYSYQHIYNDELIISFIGIAYIVLLVPVYVLLRRRSGGSKGEVPVPY